MTPKLAFMLDVMFTTPEAAEKWYYFTAIPALGGRTPDQCERSGEVQLVEDLVTSYFDPSYS